MIPRSLMIVIRRGGSGDDTDRRIQPARQFDGTRIHRGHLPTKLRAACQQKISHLLLKQDYFISQSIKELEQISFCIPFCLNENAIFKCHTYDLVLSHAK